MNRVKHDASDLKRGMGISGYYPDSCGTLRKAKAGVLRILAKTVRSVNGGQGGLRKVFYGIAGHCPAPESRMCAFWGIAGEFMTIRSKAG